MSSSKTAKKYYQANKERLLTRQRERREQDATVRTHKQELDHAYWEANKTRLIQMKTERRAIKRVAERREREVMDDLTTVTIIHDPDSIGGFPSGSRVNCLGDMIKTCSFTPNTIVERYHQKWVVEEQFGRQKLVPYEKA